MFKPLTLNSLLPRLSKTEVTNILTLREPEEADAQSFVKFLDRLIEEEAFLTTDHQTLEDELGYIKFMQSEIKDKKGIHLIVTDEKKKIAGVDVTNLETKRDHVGELQIYIDKDYRGIGLGNLLLNIIEEETKKLGTIKIIALEVFSNNDSAINLYKKLGYKVVGNQENTVRYKGQFTGMTLMQKEILPLSL